MGSLFGGSTTNAKTPKYTGMQLQTSALGVPVPIVYGTTRVGWNLADYVNFKSFKTPSSSGGKGGVVGGGGKGSSSTSYSASVVGTICEGPIHGINSSWVSQTQSAGTPNFDIFDGALAQTAWSYLTSNYPAHALTYSGFAYAAAENYDLGTSANLPNVNWEVQGLLQGTAPGTYGGNGCVSGGDADPSQVVPDLMTNAQYGFGFPSNLIGQVTSNNEAHTIPSSSAYTITVSNHSTYLYNINLIRSSDSALFTCVSGSPTASLEYSYNDATGVYTFASADAGVAVKIRYVSNGPLKDYQNATLASGLWISPAYTDQTQASSMLDDIATATFAEFVWSSGVLTMVPRHSAAVSGNGYSYTPPSSPLFSLTPDDFMPNSNAIGTTNATSTDDAVIVSRTRVSDQINDIKVEVLDRANQYATAVVEATDQALIDTYGRRGGSTKSLHMFCDVNAANVSAQLQLQDEYILNTYSFQLDERYAMLDPMDVVELTDPNYPGLTDVAVRIIEIQENDDGTLSYSAEEYPGSIGVVPAMNIDVSSGFIQNFAVDPGDAATPAIFDVPVQAVGTLGLETWLATCSASANPNWGGCDVYCSTDGTTYAKVGTLEGGSRMGSLTASLASGSDPDTSNTLSVDLSNAFGVLEAGSDSDADTDTTICFVDGEYISYSSATLTSTYHYSLGTYLRRGQWGSAISSHSSGSLFVRLDDSVFTLPYTAADKGRTIHVKLVSFNIYKGVYQDISSVTAYTHTIGGPPVDYAPSSLAAVSVPQGVQITWTNPPDIGVQAVEIWRSAGSAFSGATHIADAAAYSTSYTDQSAAPITPYWYWIRVRDIAGNTSTYDPSSGGAGVTETTGAVASNFNTGGDPSWIVNGQFVDLNGNPTSEGWGQLGTSGNISVYDDGASYAPSWPNQYLGHQVGRDVYYGEFFSVKPTDVYFMSAFVDNDTSFDCSFGLHFVDADFSALASNGWVEAAIFPPGTGASPSSFQSGQVKVSTGAFYAIVWTQINASSSFGDYYFTNVICRKSPDNDMLVNDSVATQHVQDNAINQNPSVSAGATLAYDGVTEVSVASQTFTQDFDNAPVQIVITGVATSSNPSGAAAIWKIYIDGVYYAMPHFTLLGTQFVPTPDGTLSSGSEVLAHTGSPWTMPNILIDTGQFTSGSHTVEAKAIGSNITGNSGYPNYTPIYGAPAPSLTADITIVYPIK